MNNEEITLESREIYKGKIITVHVDQIQQSSGRTAAREVVEHHGGVGILPLDAEGRVCCVRQFRYPYREQVLEIPAGKLEEGEDPLTCAVRELSEETGFSAETYVYLGQIYPSPGYCSEILHVYLATGLKPGSAHPDEGEILNVEWYTLDELTEMVMRGELKDAKTVIAILKAKRYTEERR